MSARPPRVAEWLLGRLLPSDRRDEIVGDLAEAYGRRRASRPTIACGLWYAGQVVAVPARLAAEQSIALRPDRAEIRAVLRGLVRSPGFTVVAVASLTLGIGVNVAIFGTVRALLLEPLPVPRPEELVFAYVRRPAEMPVSQFGSSTVADPQGGGQLHSNVSWSAYRRAAATTGGGFEAFGYAFVPRISVVQGGRPAVSAGGMLVSGGYFNALELPLALGRGLTPADDRPDAVPVAVVSHAFWQRSLGGDPGVVGRTIRLNGEPFELVGVTRQRYVGLSPGGFFPPMDVTVPLSSHPLFLASWLPTGGRLTAAEDRLWIRMGGRVRDAEERERARQSMTSAVRGSWSDAGLLDPDAAGQVDVRLLDASRGLDGLRTSTARPLAILAGVVAAVLLIACANIATLLLARSATRGHELAVRRAIGASRWRMTRPLFVEAAVLSATGCALGLAIASWSGPFLTSALTASLGRVTVEVQTDAVLVGVAVLVAAVAAAASVAVPAWRIARLDPGRSFESRGGRSRGVARWLVTAQIGVSMPLVVGAGLFVRTLVNLGSVDPGFDFENVAIVRVDPSLVTSDAERSSRIHRDLLERLRAIPGVDRVAAVENVLLSGWTSNTHVDVDGQERPMYMNAVSPDFFTMMGIRILAGRDVAPTDDFDAPGVALVNETARRDVFGGRALGRTFRVGERELRVVGVVADARYVSLRSEVRPTFYDPLTQRSRGIFRSHYLLRTRGPVERLEAAVREAVARVDPGLPVSDFSPYGRRVTDALARERVLAKLLSSFGAFALLLASIGLHGATSFSVARRRPEMGVRLALGARPVGLLGMVLRQVVLLVAAGLVLGIGASWLLGPVVGSLLFGLEPTDALTLSGAAGVMLGVAVLAGAWPAWRASRTDPLTSLRPSGGG